MPAVGTEEPRMTLGEPMKGADLFSYYQQIASMSLFLAKQMHLNLVKWVENSFPFGEECRQHVN